MLGRPQTTGPLLLGPVGIQLDSSGISRETCKSHEHGPERGMELEMWNGTGTRKGTGFREWRGEQESMTISCKV
jgi:hypothetical protein